MVPLRAPWYPQTLILTKILMLNQLVYNIVDNNDENLEFQKQLSVTWIDLNFQNDIKIILSWFSEFLHIPNWIWPKS